VLSILENHLCAVYYLSRKEWYFIPEPDKTPHPFPCRFSLSPVKKPSIFWGSIWEHFPSLKLSAHKNTEQKPLCPLQFGDLYCIFAASLPGKIRRFWQCFWCLPPHSRPRHGSLRGMFMSHVLLKWYWSVCTQMKEDMYEGHRGTTQKLLEMCRAQWEATGR